MERNFRKQNSRESFDSQEVSCILSPWISQFWCTPRGALFLLRDGGAHLRHSSIGSKEGARVRARSATHDGVTQLIVPLLV